MARNILIATLGDHPAVVTGMVQALREYEGLPIDTLCVLYPCQTGKDIAELGLPLIQDHLAGVCEVVPVPLPFSDPNTREKSLQFLRTIAGLLDSYRDENDYHVYLSLAGGRKNMSALMALMTQFFPSVRKLYHLIDKMEGNRHPSFPSIAEIVTQQAGPDALDPPIENLVLVEVPYPGAFSNPVELRRILYDPSNREQLESIRLSPEAEAFFGNVFRPGPAAKPLEVWLSSTAVEQYQKMTTEEANRFWRCFLQMMSADGLKNKVHHREKDLVLYKGSHRQRPFFRTEPNDIAAYPQKPVERVIVCGLSREFARGMTGPYEPDIQWQLENADRDPYQPIWKLRARERTLLVPLGKSPMIATQIYTLLQDSKEEGCPRIRVVAVLYPERHPIIRQGVELLRAQFNRKEVKFLSFPIRDLRDIDSKAAGEIYLGKLLDVIRRLRTRYPTHQVDVALSGGRKGMSALTLFAAQKAKIERVYHTLISDVDIEKQVQKETNIQALEKLPSAWHREERLFLHRYPRLCFDLFAIPVIPLKSSSH